MTQQTAVVPVDDDRNRNNTGATGATGLGESTTSLQHKVGRSQSSSNAVSIPEPTLRISHNLARSILQGSAIKGFFISLDLYLLLGVLLLTVVEMMYFTLMQEKSLQALVFNNDPPNKTANVISSITWLREFNLFPPDAPYLNIAYWIHNLFFERFAQIIMSTALYYCW